MVTRNYTPAQFETEVAKARSHGIDVPPLGEEKEIAFAGVTVKFGSKKEQDGTITTNLEVVDTPWFMPKRAAEKIIQENE